MLKLELPNTASSRAYKFEPNKNRFSKKYSVRISFKTPYYKYDDTHNILDEWINHHKAAFNSVWAQPEFCPTSRRVHYHGFVDIKDQFRMNKFLKLWKEIGSFHLERIHSPGDYLRYCLKEVGQTECMEDQYIKFLDQIDKRKQLHNIAKPHDGAPCKVE